MLSYKKYLTVFVIFLSVLITCTAKKKTKKSQKQLMLQQRETNAIDFIRLVVMRLIYGIATRIGFGENIAAALNGVFVPPGVDDYDDYGGFGLSDSDDY